MPGYHGKGLYSGQQRLVYANNGETSREAQRNPATASGVLAEWNGTDWTVIRRNQFTEVTGPGGIEGSAQPETDPLWSIGWDYRSLLLMVLDRGEWHAYRLPKASHSYDGAHGWNTEWPRIREIGEEDLLMTMHGTFWRFPKTFSAAHSAGIRPRSNYLKVVGDFCRWQDQLVFGCDDSAKSEFLNKRKAKGLIAGPGFSQSNLWFLAPERLDDLGPAIGRGAVWYHEPVTADVPSDPYLFSGYHYRGVHLAHEQGHPVQFLFEVDRQGNGTWEKLRSVEVPAKGYVWQEFAAAEVGAWIRVTASANCTATTFFSYRAADNRKAVAIDGSSESPLFASLARPNDQNYSGGIIRARGDEKRKFSFAAVEVKQGKVADEGYYEMDVDMQLRRVDRPADRAWLKQNVAVPQNVYTVDQASVLFVDDAGNRWRLPKGNAFFSESGVVPRRVDREVCTERDMFNAHGTLYELPAENAGGFAKIRPVATHNLNITDYCTWRGLLLLTGVQANASGSHVVRSDDGKAAVWVGAVDDLWQLGKPTGQGGPWNDTAVTANQPSDPYLMTGYDRKTLRLAHQATEPVTFSVQVDITGTGHWQTYQSLAVAPQQNITLTFPDGFEAYWVRIVANRNCQATAQFDYQ